MNIIKRTALLAGVVSAFVAATALASPPESFEIVYYSDASMTNVVGVKYFTCSGRRFLAPGSVVTAYSMVENVEPCY